MYQLAPLVGEVGSISIPRLVPMVSKLIRSLSTLGCNDWKQIFTYFDMLSQVNGTFLYAVMRFVGGQTF